MDYALKLKEFYDRFIEVINKRRTDKINDLKGCIEFYVSTRTTNIKFRKLIESTSISNFNHSIDNQEINYLIKKNYISQTTLPEYANGHFITIKGLAALHYDQTKDVDDLIELFEFVDKFKLPVKELSLKKEELLLVVLFLSCNATSLKNALEENNPMHSKNIYHRLQLIESELYDIVPNYLKHRIDFNKGKKVSWTRYLGEINDLSKTGIYFKDSKDAKNRYYLNLEKIKAINTLFKLSFFHLDTTEKIALMNYISKTNIKIKISMTNQVSREEIPREILNKFKA